MKTSTKKWLFLKFSSLILIPLMFWFMLNFLPLLNQDYQLIVAFLEGNITKTLISIFFIVVFFFYSLTITEIFEDYIESEKIKNVANKLVFIFAILLSLGTIITIYNL